MEEKKNIYIGQRYVPKVMGQWDSTQNYEGLSIVIHQGDSYTSKKHVPAGIEIDNEEYWVITGNYNAQIADYQNRVSQVEDKIDEKADTTYVDGEVDTLNTAIDAKADTTYVDSEVDTLNTSINQKADTSYVDSEVDTLNTAINQKADTSYVDSEVNDINDMMAFKVTKTTENIEYHVSLTGNDNNSGTSTNPFRTIAKAISMIPDTIGEDTTFSIVLGNGSWSENIEVGNKTVNGHLVIKGNTSTANNHSVNWCRFNNITGSLSVSNIMTRTQTTAGFRFNRCTYAYVTNVLAHGESTTDKMVEGYHGLLADFGSNVLVSDSEFNHKLYGIRVNYLSRVFSQRNRGTGNHRGIGARWGGILQTFESQPSGTTPRTTDSGGVIFGSRGFSFDKERDYSDFYLQENIQGLHDGLVTKRIYNIFNIMNQNQPIAPNQKLVIRFSYISYGPIILDFKYGGTQEDDMPQFIHGYWTGGVSGFVRRGKLDIISSNEMSNADVEVRKIPGEQIIELSINPQSAQSGQWSVDLSIQMMRRHSSAPKLLDVEIKSV